jgi:hypothetical protein
MIKVVRNPFKRFFREIVILNMIDELNFGIKLSSFHVRTSFDLKYSMPYEYSLLVKKHQILLHQKRRLRSLIQTEI